MADKKSPDKKSEKDPKVKAPAEAQAGKEQKEQAPLNIPDKFKDKSPEEIAKSYVELEKKLGKQAKELESGREYKRQMDYLNQVVEKNPEVYQTLEKAIKGETAKPKTQEGSGEAQVVDPQVADLRKAEENRVLNDFQFKFGIQKLEPEQRQDLMKKVSNQLAELRDPGGSKPMSQILSETKLDQLPKLFENSYWLVNKDSLMDRGKQPEQDFASIGSIPASSSSKSDNSKSLTDSERHIAGRLGVKPDKYLKQKQSMLEK